MDAATLRATQAPIKERYRSDPGAARVTLRARGTLDDARIACNVETGRALAMAWLHPATGGSGLELCSGDMLLEALVACAGVTLKAVATALEIPLRSGTVLAEGDIDTSGNLYGTTVFGGSTACYLGCGTIFKLAPPSGGGSWTETVLHDLGNSGQNPNGSIVVFHGGLLYGTTTYLGASDVGSVFTLGP